MIRKGLVIYEPKGRAGKEIAMANKNTTIQLSVETVKRLARIGRKGETYNDIIRRILDKPVAKKTS